MLSSPLRRCALTERVLPRSLLLQLKPVRLATPPSSSSSSNSSSSSSEPTRDRSGRTIVVAPSSVLHPKWAQVPSGRAFYVLLWRRALLALAQKGSYKRHVPQGTTFDGAAVAQQTESQLIRRLSHESTVLLLESRRAQQQQQDRRKGGAGGAFSVVRRVRSRDELEALLRGRESSGGGMTGGENKQEEQETRSSEEARWRVDAVLDFTRCTSSTPKHRPEARGGMMSGGQEELGRDAEQGFVVATREGGVVQYDMSALLVHAPAPAHDEQQQDQSPSSSSTTTVTEMERRAAAFASDALRTVRENLRLLSDDKQRGEERAKNDDDEMDAYALLSLHTSGRATATTTVMPSGGEPSTRDLLVALWRLKLWRGHGWHDTPEHPLGLGQQQWLD